MAVTLTSAELASHFGETDDATWAALRAAAAAMVDAESGEGAVVPDAISNEAAIRVAGCLYRDRQAARLIREIASEVPTDRLGADRTYLPLADAMRFMRASGARALLAPFKARSL